MKRLWQASLMILLLAATACEHKDLCVDHREHAHRYHIHVLPEYRMVWEEYNKYDFEWEQQWPDHYLDYESLRPGKPEGLRVVNSNKKGNTNTHNISADGGVVTLYEGLNDVLFYNNDTEYIVFSRGENTATTRATTRTRTRATYNGSRYANEGEETMTPPDVLYANYFADFEIEKVLEPHEVEVTLHPLVFTYKVRYEFAEGQEYVAMARGALSGMARSVLISSGETSAEGATLLYDCEVTDFGARALVNSFGIPAYPNDNYPSRAEQPRHALNLEVMLRNGSMINFDFDVTEQVQAQPHGGVIVVDGIVIEPSQGTSGSGAFDVEVNDWGEYEDIPLPL